MEHQDNYTLNSNSVRHTMKHLILFIHIALIIVSCGSSFAAERMTVGFLVGISGLGDQSFNDMTYAGLFKAKQEFGLRLIYEDSEKNDAAFEAAMERLLENGAKAIVANGFYMKELVEKFATRYPDRLFIIQDAEIDNMPNVACVIYSVEEGSFLAGALAGLMTRTNKVGFIGGVDIPVMHVFRSGYAAGVKYVNPEATILEEFVSKAPDYSGFNKPEVGHDMALAAYNNDVDIIFAAAGLTGNGVLAAARKTGKYAIGVDSDQDHLAQGHVLTSMMKRLDIATYNEVQEIVSGKFSPGVKRYGLRENGVGLSAMKFTRHLIPAPYLERLEEIENSIIDGTILVTNSLETR